MPTKVRLVKAIVFPVVVWMWELDSKESWAPKKWCFWAVVLEKTLKSPLDCKEIQPVHPKGHQSWVFIGRTDAETPIFWPPDAKSWLTWKDPDTGRDWRQEEKGTTEDEMVGWHHQLNGHEFEQVPRADDGQVSLVCCSPWGSKELDVTEWLILIVTDPSPFPSKVYLLLYSRNFWYSIDLDNLIKTRVQIIVTHKKKV